MLQGHTFAFPDEYNENQVKLSPLMGTYMLKTATSNNGYEQRILMLLPEDEAPDIMS